MNWQHLKAFIWLRWRLSVNQWRRAGKVNAILMMILVGLALAITIPLFVGVLALGIAVIPKAEPVHLLYAWDALLMAFVFFSCIGLVAELQRTESLSLSKFMHLPVSVNGAFLINYVASLVRLSLIIFLPVMLAFWLAMVIAKGLLMVLILPVLLAFLLMVTALSYQFQGWLASLMTNPRRRRTVIVSMTAIIILIAQVPNLFNMLWIRNLGRKDQPSTKLQEELSTLTHQFTELEQSFKDLKNKGGDATELQRLNQELEALQQRQAKVTEEFVTQSNEEQQELAAFWARSVKLASLIVPIGWLPLGVMAATDGSPLPAALAFLGLAGIGTVSLWRSYRTTVRFYQGQFTARGAKAPRESAQATEAVDAASTAGRTSMVEARLPWLSEPVSAVALTCFRGLVRSPEAKMMLLTPLILGVIFGSMLLRGPAELPLAVGPLTVIGAMMLVIFGTLPMLSNQFGFDREGFRVFVLCAVPRRDILLGKNLAFAPVPLVMGLLMLLAMQAFRPLRWDHFLAMFPQFIAMYLLVCPVANLVSIFAPMPIAAGSLKPGKVKLVPVLLQMLMTFTFFPLVMLPTLIPVGIEAALEYFELTRGVPIFLLLSLLECAAVVFAYRLVLRWQGTMLQSQELKILETVTSASN